MTQFCHVCWCTQVVKTLEMFYVFSIVCTSVMLFCSHAMFYVTVILFVSSLQQAEPILSKNEAFSDIKPRPDSLCSKHRARNSQIESIRDLPVFSLCTGALTLRCN